MNCNMYQNDKICFSSSVIKTRIIARASILTTLVTDQNSNLNDQFTINKIEVKQIKPTIIYNETPWTPIVPLNYKTQITNTQWVVLSINLQPRNSDSDNQRKKKNKTREKQRRNQQRTIFLNMPMHTKTFTDTIFFLHSLRGL